MILKRKFKEPEVEVGIRPSKGTLKLQDWTFQDWTMTDDFAGVDNTGLDIDVNDRQCPVRQFQSTHKNYR